MKKIRETIRKAAPEAKEKISYQIPTFKLGGNLVHFAAFTKHISFFPTSSGIAKYKKELEEYETSKGTDQFPLDKPIPYNIITRITKFRARENLEKTKIRTGHRTVERPLLPGPYFEVPRVVKNLTIPFPTGSSSSGLVSLSLSCRVWKK